MTLGLAQSLSTLVKQKYDTAKAGQSLIFSHTHLALIRIAAVPFQLRYCPALSKKPTEDDHPNQKSPSSKRPDPFADPPSDLLIAQIPHGQPTHTLVLNKYPVISSHFILATKSYKRQTDLLDSCDLAITFDCLKAWASGIDPSGTPKKLFAFFNSGPHSGASQAHRHVQFLPVEEMEDAQAAAGWSLLLDSVSAGPPLSNYRFSLYSLPELPFVHFSVRIPSDPSPDQLSDRYRYLYENAVAAFQDYANRHPEEKLVVSPDGQDGSAMISYNLALTTSSMAICPRRSEATTLKKSEKNVGTSLGPVAVNGTVLAGALMVKTEEEFHKMQRDESNLYSLLQELGIPIERHHDNANEHL
ncbi:bifunctional AP-4-A phosphorylase/ADP sulfurylase [Acarospora aff. strigata]|nr:bifunctional AP-4-A phosphorylase/ADP sulfurylase [Acarospora aff. strigata]